MVWIGYGTYLVHPIIGYGQIQIHGLLLFKEVCREISDTH